MQKNTLWKVLLGVVLVVVVLGMGAFAYRAGMAQGMAFSGQFEGGRNLMPGSRFAMPYDHFAMPYGGMRPYGGHSFFGGLLGFFGLLLLASLVFAAIRGLFWGRMRHGYSMHGNWEKGVPPMFDEWHRRAHAAETAAEAPKTDAPDKPAE